MGKTTCLLALQEHLNQRDEMRALSFSVGSGPWVSSRL
jgi:hypothetical protein